MRDSTPLSHFGPAGNATPPPPSESTAVALQYTAVLHALQLLLYLSVSCVSRQFGAPEFGEGPASLSPVVLDARDLSLDSEMAADVDLLGARGSRILMQWTYILHHGCRAESFKDVSPDTAGRVENNGRGTGPRPSLQLHLSLGTLFGDTSGVFGEARGLRVRATRR